MSSECTPVLTLVGFRVFCMSTAQHAVLISSACKEFEYQDAGTGLEADTRKAYVWARHSDPSLHTPN